jgi:5S rRNA maturation endonuclease (ribonuclease M5)
MNKGGNAVKDLSIVKELIRESIDPARLLEYYGVDIGDSNFRYDRVRCECPIHGGDNPSAFSFDLNSKQFTCYTNHCGENPEDWWFVPKNGAQVPRDMFLFIKLMEEKKAYERGISSFTCTFSQAVKIASELSGIAINETTSAYNKTMIDKLDNQKWARQMSRVGREIELEIFNQDEIDLYRAQLPLCDYINSRMYDDSIINFFEIGFAPEGIDEPYRAKRKDFAGRIVFPVRDADGNLVGWSGRLATDDEALIKTHNKWMHKLDFDKGFVLYNFNNAKEHIRQSKELIILEGPWDVARLWSYGIHNVVAVMGSSLTPEQLSLAITYAIKIKVFLDPDGAGKTGARRICDQIKRYVDTYTITAPAGKDPDELTHEEAWECVKGAERYKE